MIKCSWNDYTIEQDPHNLYRQGWTTIGTRITQIKASRHDAWPGEAKLCTTGARKGRQMGGIFLKAKPFLGASSAWWSRDSETVQYPGRVSPLVHCMVVHLHCFPYLQSLPVSSCTYFPVCNVNNSFLKKEVSKRHPQRYSSDLSPIIRKKNVTEVMSLIRSCIVLIVLFEIHRNNGITGSHLAANWNCTAALLHLRCA